MSWTVFRSTLHLKRTSLLWYSIGVTAYGWWVVSFYPSISKSVDYMKAITDMMSPEMLAMFGGSGLDLATFGGFAGIEYLSLMWVLIAAAAIVSFAAGALGGAIDNGSMETTLSMPVSRTQVVVSRYLAMAAYAGVLSLVTAATLYVPSLIYDVDMSLEAAMTLFAVSWLLQMAVGGLAYLLSALSSSSGRPLAVTLGVVTAMWLVDALGALSDNLEWVRDYSLFRYWTPGRILQGEAVAEETWIVFASVSVIFFVASIFLFRRRDVV